MFPNSSFHFHGRADFELDVWRAGLANVNVVIVNVNVRLLSWAFPLNYLDCMKIIVKLLHFYKRDAWWLAITLSTISKVCDSNGRHVMLNTEWHSTREPYAWFILLCQFDALVITSLHPDADPDAKHRRWRCKMTWRLPRNVTSHHGRPQEL